MDELVELAEREQQWRHRLVGTSLVMEADVDQNEAIESFGWLGARYRRCDTRDERQALLAKFRANFVIGLTAVSSRDYDEGALWPFVGAAFGLSLSQGDVDVISKRYKDILNHYGLRRFSTPMANVGEILMHAGVPVGSVEGFLRLLVKQDRRGSGTTGALFAAWAKSQNRQSASLLGLDAPTWRFLREGGEIAEDFVDRCLAAFDAATSGGVAPDSGLARHIVDEIGRLVETGALVRRASRGTRIREVVYVPVLTWEGTTHGVAIVLPTLEVVLQDTVHWTLTSEGRSTSYLAEPPWPGVAAKPTIHALPRPTKAVSVRARPGEQEWELAVVDPDDPMLLFDASTGAIIPARNSLPRDRVVIGVPTTNEQTFEELVEFEGEFNLNSLHQSPFGWESWAFATVDLSHVQKIRRGGDRWRFVSSSTRPHVTYPEALLGTTTADGSPVFGTAPAVTLPSTSEPNALSIPWIISIADELSGTALWSTEVRLTVDQQIIELWPERSAPLLGRFVIAVRGPLGRGITRRVVIAEGWQATHEPAFRYLTGEGTGLESATVTLVSENTGAHHISLDRSTTSSSITISDESEKLELTVCVPHMDIAVSRGGFFPIVTLLPQSIEIESLEDSHLRVTVPAGLRAMLALVVADRVEQIIDEGITGERGYVNFDIRQLTDTAKALRAGLLQLRIGDRSVPVGNLRPRKLADCVEFDPDRGSIRISPTAPDGLTAAIYSKFAPWKVPTVISFASGSEWAVLGGDAREIGEAIVVLRVDDPWSPSPWPITPERKSPNVFGLTVSPVRLADGTPEVAFMRWLAGVDDRPSSPNALPIAAKVLSLLNEFEPIRPRDQLRAELSAMFGSHPSLFIDAVMQAPLEPSVLMRLVVESGLAATGSEIPPPVSGSWALNSFLGLIGDYEGTQQDSDPEFISNLENFAGVNALTLLDSGNDPDAKIGRFNESAHRMSSFSQEQLEKIWVAASPIPGRLLQKDTRMLAARQLFDARTARPLRDLIASSAHILARTKRTIHAVFGPGGEAPIEARIGSDGWRNLPALSMALAIIARLAARDLGGTREVYALLRDYYAQLAETAPAFVEMDLVIAELWIMNWRNEWTR